MSSISVLIFIVSSATLILLGINVFLMMRSKKQEPDEKYLVLHQRFDALSAMMNDQLEKNRQAGERATLTANQEVKLDLLKLKEDIELIKTHLFKEL